MNDITLEKLHYNEMKEIVKGYCISGLGKELIDRLKPVSSLKAVKVRQQETSEGRALIDASYTIPLEGIFNVTPLIERMEKGASLEPEDLTMMSDFLRGCRKVKRFMEDKQGYAPNLSLYSRNITDLSFIEEEINMSIRGSRVDSNASRELRKIRRSIDICEGKITDKLDGFLKKSEYKKYLQDAFISRRNGRYTLPVKASYKNQFPGAVIEVSQKGSTVLMEPYAVERYTSELMQLQAEESVEEYRILSSLTEMLYSRIKDIKLNVEIMAQYDMIWAKAKYSRAIGGISPNINSRGYIKIVNGRYPLIENCVPLDFEIGEDYRSLIITGPNAGGKTVVLKSVGMMVLCAESGFHVAASEGTDISVFDNIFVDIGDGQSVENSLSTFSSHVKNLSYIIRHSTKSTLLLFDEIGSGTEPNEGAALAISILEELYLKGCITVATTHYGEIKNFSNEHPDFENAAMEFRSDTLEPLYKLHIGKSGDSNALYIAKKMGIPQAIIEKTKRYIDTKDYECKVVRKERVLKEKDEAEIKENYEYGIGDRVKLLDSGKTGIIYKEKDSENNVEIMYEGEFIKVNVKRIKLDIKACELYPEGYDMNQLFISFKDRKLEHDIERGSKKALKKIRKEMDTHRK